MLRLDGDVVERVALKQGSAGCINEPSASLDFPHRLIKLSAMVEPDTHIVSRLAGISTVGCRDVDHAS